MWCVSLLTRLFVPDTRVRGRGRSPDRLVQEANRKEVTVTNEEIITQLTERLVTANAREAARIRTRIQEIRAMSKSHDHQ